MLLMNQDILREHWTAVNVLGFASFFEDYCFLSLISVTVSEGEITATECVSLIFYDQNKNELLIIDLGYYAWL